jgi:alkylation response protein AidB-like acyl-CoA dehydrogenase
LRATEAREGYLLDGHVPWITGYGLFPEYLVAAELADGRAVFAVVPFTPGTGASFSKPMRLAAMESAQTVTADYESFEVSKSQVVAVQPAGWIKNNDQINIALQRHFALGCCEAALDILRDQVRKKGEPSVINALTALEVELDACRTAVLPSAGEDESAEARLAARAWAIELCTRCAHAAIASCGGQANSVDHPAQRVFRESLVYTVSAQTPSIREATLQRLVRLS